MSGSCQIRGINNFWVREPIIPNRPNIFADGGQSACIIIKKCIILT